MAENTIDINLLRKYDGLLKSFGSILNRSTTYTLGTVVSCKGKYLRCVTAGTTGLSALDLNNVSAGDEIIDGTVTWVIFDPFSGSSGTSTILYKGTTWNNTDTSIVTSDIANYDFLYINYSLSDDGLTSDIDMTRIFTKDDLASIDLGVKIDTTHYVCLLMEKTSNTGFNLDFREFSTYGYYRINKIVGVVGGGSSGTTISDWATGTTYSVGDLVIQDNNIYQCNTNHTSTTFTADVSKWTLIGGQGASEELYSSNTWLNTDTNLTLSSAVTTYDFIIIKVDYSLDGTTSEISKQVIATNDIDTNISLTLNRNSTQYCVLEGQLTSSTVFTVDALELAGFTKFRINKIIGVIGGGGGDSSTPATSAQIQSLF